MATALLLALAAGGCAWLTPQHDEPTASMPAPLIETPEPDLRPPLFEAPFADPHEGDATAPMLWDEVRAGFGLEAYRDHPRVAEETERFLAQSTLPIEVERARYFLPFIVEEVRARDLPLELALLPFIESTMDPYAFSAGGAAGVWQLIPATARRFGIEIGWWYDGRRDIVDSTGAALDYLSYLQGLFDDWLLAIAAYNAGEGRIGRALGRSGEGTAFWALSLPPETMRYVPRLLALSALVAEAEAFGIELPPLEPVPAFTVIELDGQIDLTAFAERAELPASELFKLNAGLNHGATPPSVPRRLLVPKPYREQAEGFVARESSAGPIWSHHEVERGETLSAIAQAFGTTVEAIQSANALNGHLIRPGERLLVPQARLDPGEVPGNPLLRGRTGGRDYEVRPGDSLWTISRRFGTTVDTLVRLNRLDPRAPLRPGQRLTLPPHGDASAEPALSPGA